MTLLHLRQLCTKAIVLVSERLDFILDALFKGVDRVHDTAYIIDHIGYPLHARQLRR